MANSDAIPYANSPDWRRLYETALLEKDPSKLIARISAARGAILDRIEDNLKNPALSEQGAMNDALRNLRRLAEVASTAGAA